MSPIFSIFTSVYNAEKYIGKCLDSVLKQSLNDFEWYIHDDGSTDASYQICADFAQKDDRIILSQGNNGTCISKLNQFLKEAKGKYVAFIDHDDLWEPDYLETIYNRLNTNNVDGAITSYTLINADGDRLGWYTPILKDGEILNSLELKRRFLTSLEIEGFRWNKFYKTDLYRKSKLEFQRKFPADIRFEYDLFDYVNTVVLVESKGYYYRQLVSSEVGDVNIDKTLGMLETFKIIGNRAIEEGLVEEGWYYRSWRYINNIFLRIQGGNFSNEELQMLFKAFSWKSEVQTNIIKTLIKFGKYKNRRDGNFKFAIKTILVWMKTKKYRFEV